MIYLLFMINVIFSMDINNTKQISIYNFNEIASIDKVDSSKQIFVRFYLFNINNKVTEKLLTLNNFKKIVGLEFNRAEIDDDNFNEIAKKLNKNFFKSLIFNDIDIDEDYKISLFSKTIETLEFTKNDDINDLFEYFTENNSDFINLKSLIVRQSNKIEKVVKYIFKVSNLAYQLTQLELSACKLNNYFFSNIDFNRYSKLELLNLNDNEFEMTTIPGKKPIYNSNYLSLSQYIDSVFYVNWALPFFTNVKRLSLSKEENSLKSIDLFYKDSNLNKFESLQGPELSDEKDYTDKGYFRKITNSIAPIYDLPFLSKVTIHKFSTTYLFDYWHKSTQFNTSQEITFCSVNWNYNSLKLALSKLLKKKYLVTLRNVNASEAEIYQLTKEFSSLNFNIIFNVHYEPAYWPRLVPYE